jgi:integrase
MGLFKRGQTWWIRFTYKEKQIRKSTETDDKKLAERIYHKVLGEVAEGKWFEKLPGEEKTFREMMDRYKSEYLPLKSHPKKYGSIIKNLLFFFGDFYITKITPSLVKQYKIRGEEKKIATNRELSVLRAAFNIAIKEWEWLKDNPVNKIKPWKEPPGRVRYLSDEEFDKLLNECRDWLKSIVTVARHTGLRKENILSLTWSQVDLFRRMITLHHTKNNERLSIPLNDTLMSLFKQLSRVRHINSAYVFSKPDGSRYCSIHNEFKKAVKNAGITDFKFHDLRHCFASALVQKGVDLYQVQKLLGHRSNVMTQRYAHLSPEHLREAVNRLDSTKLAQCQDNDSESSSNR